MESFQNLLGVHSSSIHYIFGHYFSRTVFKRSAIQWIHSNQSWSDYSFERVFSIFFFCLKQYKKTKKLNIWIIFTFVLTQDCSQHYIKFKHRCLETTYVKFISFMLIPKQASEELVTSGKGSIKFVLCLVSSV